MDTFNFAYKHLVPKTVPPDPIQGVSMNGWTFTAKPTVPYQRKFSVTLYGMRWFLDPTTGLFDTTSYPSVNARLLEMFYETHGVWNPFNWNHPHFGNLTVRFNAPLNVPEALPNSNGLIDKVDLTFIHHNPGY